MFPPEMLWEFAKQQYGDVLRLAAVERQVKRAQEPHASTPPIVIPNGTKVGERVRHEIEAILAGANGTMGEFEGDRYMTTSPIIDVQGLVKRFGDFTAVNGIDFAVMPGECFGILGPNGAGKTSTIRMLTCVSPVTAGRMLVDGRDVTREPRAVKSVLGVVPQDNNLDPDLSVRENLITYARFFDIPADEAKRRADETLELVQLTDKADTDVYTLSGGMKRRLVIARALLNRPKVLVLDEPTTGLDPQARRMVWQQVRQLQQAGVTVLLTTHYMEEAAQLCSRLVVMYQGQILCSGTPQELIVQYAGREVVELRLERQQREALKAQLDGAPVEVDEADDELYIFSRDGVRLDSLPGLQGLEGATPRPGTLEDVFLRLTGRLLVD